MCFVSNGSKKPLIAEEDIICYKKLTVKKAFLRKTRYYGYFRRSYRFYLKKLHSIDASLKPLRASVTGYFIVEEGFHSFVNTPLSEDYFFGVGDFYECIIPKGSEYFNNGDVYVSNQIIINKKLDF